MPLQLVDCKSVSDDVLYDAAELLSSYWTGSIATRKHQMLSNTGSYVFVKEDNNDNHPQQKGIGHVKVIPYSATGDDAFGPCLCGVVTSVIIAEEYRGQGYGYRLMQMLEDVAINLGYCFLYLWTSDAVEFYLKVGYRRCERVHEAVSALKSMSSTSISKLESMISNKAAVVLDLDGAGGTMSTVYMKKRIRDEVPLEPWTISELRAQLVDDISPLVKKDNLFVDVNINHVPWGRQVGPSCGIQALRMTAAYLNRSTLSPSKSLLQEAIDKGYSSEGEIFDINHISALAVSIHLSARVCPLSVLGFNGIRDLLSTSPKSVIILPYDKGPSCEPCTEGGRRAHYAVICGAACRYSADVVGCSRDERVRVIIDSDNAIQDWPHDNSTEQSNEFLIALQGLSKRPIIASYSQWKESNAQLFDNSLCKDSSTIDDRGKLARQNIANSKWMIPTAGPNLSGMCVIVSS